MKVAREGASLMRLGRSFQRTGAATEKALSPQVLNTFRDTDKFKFLRLVQEANPLGKALKSFMQFYLSHTCVFKMIK